MSVPKLRDDGSNWSDYLPRVERALGAKGLWRHVLGTAIAPRPYELKAGVPVLADGTTPATEEQIESKEDELDEFDRKEYLAQHMILSTLSTRLKTKIIRLMSAKEMWKVVEEDAKSKSALFILDNNSQLSSMKLHENVDPEAHPEEMKEHPQMMVQSHEYILKMGSEIPDTRTSTLVTSSPESCRTMLQTVTATEAERGVSEQALVAHAEPKAIVKGKGEEKSKAEDQGMKAKSEITCHNCGKAGHKKHACYSKGGGKEGQAPWQTKRKDKDRLVENEAVEAANGEDEMFFTFSCILEFTNVAEETQVPRLKLGAYMKSGSIPVEGDIKEEMGSGFVIQYPERSVEKSQIEPEIVVDGEIGGHSSCYQEYSLEFAAVNQAMDDPRTTQDPGVRITEEPAIESRRIRYSRHVTRPSWKSAHRGKPLKPSVRVSTQSQDPEAVQPRSKIPSGGRSFYTGRTAHAAYRPPQPQKSDDLDWRARKGPVVPDGSKQWIREAFRSYRKGGKPKNSETKAEYVRNNDRTVPISGALSEGEKEDEKVIQYPRKSSRGRRKKARACPTCKRVYPESVADAAVSNTGNIEGQRLPHGRRPEEKAATSSTSRTQTPEVVGGGCIEYKGQENNTKRIRTLGGVGEGIGNKEVTKIAPILSQHKNLSVPSNTPLSEAIHEGSSKGEQSNAARTPEGDDKPKHDVKNVKNSRYDPKNPPKSPASKPVQERLSKGEQTRTQRNDSMCSRNSKATNKKSRPTNVAEVSGGPGGRQRDVGYSSYPIQTSELVEAVEDTVRAWPTRSQNQMDLRWSTQSQNRVDDAKSNPNGRR